MNFLATVETLVALNEVMVVAGLALSFITFFFLLIVLAVAAKNAKQMGSDVVNMSDEELLSAVQVTPWMLH